MGTAEDRDIRRDRTRPSEVASRDLVTREANNRALETAEGPACISDASDMKELADHLAAAGHRNVFAMGGVDMTPADQLQRESAVQPLADSGSRRSHVKEDPHEYESGSGSATRIFEEPRRADSAMHPRGRITPVRARIARALVEECTVLGSKGA